MRIVEQFVRSKRGPASEGEDAVIVTPDFACVIDGATSVMPPSIPGCENGLRATQILVTAIELMPSEVSPHAAVQFLSAQIKEFYVNTSLLELARDNPGHRLAASIAMYSRARREIWMVGDCQCLVGGHLVRREKLVDWITASARAMYLQAELRRGKSIEQLRRSDTGRKFIKPLLEQQRWFENVSTDKGYDYGVIDGFQVPRHFVDIIAVDEDVNEIVLATDGYPVILPTLNESETALADLIAADPLCISVFKSTKGVRAENESFDDRAYIKIAIQKDVF